MGGGGLGPRKIVRERARNGVGGGRNSSPHASAALEGRKEVGRFLLSVRLLKIYVATYTIVNPIGAASHSPFWLLGAPEVSIVNIGLSKSKSVANFWFHFATLSFFRVSP